MASNFAPSWNGVNTRGNIPEDVVKRTNRYYLTKCMDCRNTISIDDPRNFNGETKTSEWNKEGEDVKYPSIFVNISDPEMKFRCGTCSENYLSDIESLRGGDTK
tara:strand:- start:238 stop:549 length:312 start_codon:yes stop_codon:yes gene_type:complete